MDVIQFIEAIERDYLEEDLEELSPKDRILIYLNAKEFNMHKLQRSTAAPTNSTDTNFTVEHVT